MKKATRLDYEKANGGLIVQKNDLEKEVRRLDAEVRLLRRVMLRVQSINRIASDVISEQCGDTYSETYCSR